MWHKSRTKKNTQITLICFNSRIYITSSHLNKLGSEQLNFHAKTEQDQALFGQGLLLLKFVTRNLL